MLDKLKKLFVIEDEDSTKPSNTASESSSEKKSTEPDPIVNSSPVKVLKSYNTPSGKADPKFIDILLNAIDKNNLDGFDYLEYKSSLQGLDDMSMDEATRYKSAYVMAQTMGATKSKLLDSAKYYINVLNTEESKFKDALKNQKAKQVTGKEQELVRLQKEIEAKKAQIAQLEKEIKANEKSYQKIKEGINKSATKVDETNNRFMNAYQVMLGQIMTDVENMKKYLS